MKRDLRAAEHRWPQKPSEVPVSHYDFAHNYTYDGTSGQQLLALLLADKIID